jgi:eukaryotic translation initiation factor 2C
VLGHCVPRSCCWSCNVLFLLQLLVKEYNAIREAGLELEDGYTPPITFITVLKRHRARFFPSSDEANDGGGNVKPGMCIDTSVTLPTGFDFYINSHKGIQGTVKPAHYHVLHDENNYGADAIQVATYWLCYTFCRCTRSVSKCAPAYYAHLAAERGRNLLDRESIIEDFAVQSTRSGASSGSDRPAPKFFAPHIQIQDKMFFV